LFGNIFNNKIILVTGHTGFKGSWLAMWLNLLGSNVVGISLDPTSHPSHYGAAKISSILENHTLDIRDCESLKSLIYQIQPDFVFHLAAQALVSQSYDNPVATYQTNSMGTLHLLEALRSIKKKCTAVLITSDKCYDNVEWVWGYRETDSLGGSDPYSASKGAAELVIRSHVKSFFPRNGLVRVAVGRAGNVIGGGDWAVDRIVPDCIRSWAKNEIVKIRNPRSTRPWQHVLEPLGGYLKLAEALHQSEKLHGEAFNFGPPSHQNYSVLELVQTMSRHWNKVHWEEVSETEKQNPESGLLKLNCDKALHHLNWKANLSFKETVRITVEWYRSYYEKPSSIKEVTLSQIKEYETLFS
jgi:CDP-glucose 4,6-dehydratase